MSSFENKSPSSSFTDSGCVRGSSTGGSANTNRPSAFSNNDEEEDENNNSESSSSSEAQEPAAPTGIIHSRSTQRHRGGMTFSSHIAHGRDVWFSENIQAAVAKKLSRYVRRQFLRSGTTPSDGSQASQPTSPLTGTTTTTSGSKSGSSNLDAMVPRALVGLSEPSSNYAFSPISPHGGANFRDPAGDVSNDQSPARGETLASKKAAAAATAAAVAEAVATAAKHQRKRRKRRAAAAAATAAAAAANSPNDPWGIGATTNAPFAFGDSDEEEEENVEDADGDENQDDHEDSGEEKNVRQYNDSDAAAAAAAAEKGSAAGAGSARAPTMELLRKHGNSNGIYGDVDDDDDDGDGNRGGEGRPETGAATSILQRASTADLTEFTGSGELPSSTLTGGGVSSTVAETARARRQRHQEQLFQVRRLATGGNGTILLANCGSSRIVLKLTDYDNAMRESSILRRLSNVPNVIHLLGFVCKPHQQSLVYLEFASGGSLRAKAAEVRFSFKDDSTWVHRREALMRPYVKQMLAAVNALHMHGIVHLDLKCDNFVLADDQETVKLIDFGTSRFCEQSPATKYGACDTRGSKPKAPQTKKRASKRGSRGATRTSAFDGRGGGSRPNSKENSEATVSETGSPITPGRGAVTFEDPDWQPQDENHFRHAYSGSSFLSDDDECSNVALTSGHLPTRERLAASERKQAQSATSSSGDDRAQQQQQQEQHPHHLAPPPPPPTSHRPAHLHQQQAAFDSHDDDDDDDDDGPLEQTLGSVLWMAPEILRGQASSYQPSADIWSLGCAIVEVMMGGEPPWCEGFATPHSAVWAIGISKAPPSNIPRDTSPALGDFFEQCFQQEPSKRASARQLLAHPWVQGHLTSHNPHGAGSSSAEPSSTDTNNGSALNSSGNNDNKTGDSTSMFKVRADASPVPLLNAPPPKRAGTSRGSSSVQTPANSNLQQQQGSSIVVGGGGGGGAARPAASSGAHVGADVMNVSHGQEIEHHFPAIPAPFAKDGVSPASTKLALLALSGDTTPLPISLDNVGH